MRQKNARRKGKVNVEERATQRAVSAYITWSVEEDGLGRRVFPHGEAGFSVVDFPNRTLWFFREAHPFPQRENKRKSARDFPSLKLQALKGRKATGGV